MSTVAPARNEWLRAVLAGGADWIADCGCLAFAFLAVGSPVPWQGLLLAYCAAQLAVNLPITPGGLGVVEGSLTVALVAFGGGRAPDGCRRPALPVDQFLDPAPRSAPAATWRWLAGAGEGTHDTGRHGWRRAAIRRTAGRFEQPDRKSRWGHGRLTDADTGSDADRPCQPMERSRGPPRWQRVGHRRRPPLQRSSTRRGRVGRRGHGGGDQRARPSGRDGGQVRVTRWTSGRNGRQTELTMMTTLWRSVARVALAARHWLSAWAVRSPLAPTRAPRWACRTATRASLSPRRRSTLPRTATTSTGSSWSGPGPWSDLVQPARP